MSESESDDNVFTGRTLNANKNPIHNYFTVKSKEARTCISCRTDLSSKSGTTTALINHLKRKHSTIYEKYNKEKQEWLKKTKLSKAPPKLVQVASANQPTIHATIENQTRWTASNPQTLKLNQQVGRFIVGGLHAYSVVEEKEFKKLLELACPKYSLPSRTTFSRSVIPKMHEEMIGHIKEELKIISTDLESLSFTTDGWTSRNNDSYLSLTCHYINSDFQLKSFCLSLKELNERHTGVNIINAIKDSIADWDLTRLTQTIPIYVVTDGAANMNLAVELSKWNHIHCFGHTLQLCVESAIKESVQISNLLAKCRQIVGHYSRSSSAMARLLKEQEKLDQTPLKLIQDVPTRWNSQYYMLERLSYCRGAISKELGTSDNNITFLKGQEWKSVENVLSLFKPLVEATEIASGENYPTLSTVLPMLKGIENVIEEIIQENGPFPLAESLKKQLRTRFSPIQTDQTYIVSTLVDPRYKLLGLKDDVHILAKTFLNNQIKKITNQETVTIQDQEFESAPSSSKNIFGFLTKSCQTQEKSNEVEMYLNLPLINHTEDPLAWWRANKLLFPAISKIASKHLGIPATSVSSERFFSASGNIVTSRRTQLTSEHVNQLVVLHENLHMI